MPSPRRPRGAARLVVALALPAVAAGFLVPGAPPSRAAATAAATHAGPPPPFPHTRSSSSSFLPRRAQRADNNDDEEEVVVNGGGGDEELDFGDWVEPWLNAESRDVMRISFNCYDEDGRMLIDPWLLSELLLETGAYSSQIEDAAKGSKEETPIFGEHGEPAAKEKIWAKSAVLADYGLDTSVSAVLQLVKDAFQLEGEQPFRYKVERIEDRDWQREVQEGWKPIRLGKRLLVKFTWHGESDVKPFLEATPGLQLMTLEGGAAFGSGEHATTTMCCEWLERRLQQQRATAGAPPLRVIDYGSGSGILALAALMFGAQSAVGVEIDPIAIQSAYRNAEMNGIETVFLLPEETRDDAADPDAVSRVAFHVVQPDGSIEEEEEVALQPADIMVANILARPLVELAPRIAALTRCGGGQIVLAGLLEEQAETVMAAYRPWFDDMKMERVMGDWALLVGTRNDQPEV